MIELQVFGRPAPQGSKKVFPVRKGRGADAVITGHRMQEMSPHLNTWRDDVRVEAEKRIKGQGLPPLGGPLRVRMVFTMAKPMAAPKRRRTWPAKIPDLSKLARSTEDALTSAGFWEDDKLVVEYSRLAKVYPNEDPDSLPVPGVRIWVEQVTEENCGESTAA